MFETPDTVFNNLELLVKPSSTAKKCSATEDCCRNPGGDRHPSSTVKYCSATGLLPNRQRGERPGVNGLPFSHRRKETPVFNKLQLLVNRRLLYIYIYIYIYVYIFQAVRRAVNVRNPGHRLQQLRTARETVFNS